MRRTLVIGLALAAVLAGCQREQDPQAQNRSTCLNANAAAQPRVDACTALIDAGVLTQAERADALAARGVAHRSAGQVTAGLRDFEAALRVNERQADALEGRAAILIASGQLDAAEPMIERLIAAGGRLDQAHLMEGDIALGRGDAVSAAAAYDQAIAANGDLALAYARRARAKEQLGDHEAARADYDAAIRKDGALAAARAGRCWLNLTQKTDLEQARNDAEASVAAAPRLVEAQLCRGVLQLQGGEWANARASFEVALSVEPGNPVALFGHGVARRRSGDDAGSEDMNQARDFDHHIGETFDELGVETY